MHPGNIQFAWNSWKFVKKTKVQHADKYSQPLLSTSLKHLWQQLQPPMFLSTMLQAFTSVFGQFLLVFAEPLRLHRVGWGVLVQRCLIEFKSGLRLHHPRTFTDWSPSHFFVVLAACLRSLSCWKMNSAPAWIPKVIWRLHEVYRSLVTAAN